MLPALYLRYKHALPTEWDLKMVVSHHVGARH